MTKKIDNHLAGILKGILNEELKEFKHICIDDFFKFSANNYFFELTIIFDNKTSVLLKERIVKNDNIFQITYIPRTSLERNLNFENKYIFNRFPHSTILKDENRILVNLKSAAIFFIEKHKTLIHKVEIDQIRWIVSNQIDAIKHYDSKYLRYKIYESLIKLYNSFSMNDHIAESSLPVLMLNPGQHTFISQIVNDDLSADEFEQKMIGQLKSFGGLLSTIDSKASFYADEIVLVFKYDNLDLDSFIENIFLRFFTITKTVNHHLKSFYWEKNTEGQFILYLNADRKVIENEIFPELLIKLSSNIQLKNIGDLSTVYDFFQEYYFSPLHRLCEYVLHLKTDEYVQWSESVTISYSIELYISYFVRSGFSKQEFLEFNKYLSQKWQLLLLSDEELISNEYFTISEIYRKFEKLYIINEVALLENFSVKLDEWLDEGSFEEEIIEINNSIRLFLEQRKNITVSTAILSDFSENNKYAFLEGFLFKAFGLLGLDTQSKAYVTYIINRLGNES